MIRSVLPGQLVAARMAQSQPVICICVLPREGGTQAIANHTVRLWREEAGQAPPDCYIFLESVELQQRLFTAALLQIVEYGEPVNQVLEVDLQGEEVVISSYDLPLPPPPPEDPG